MKAFFLFFLVYTFIHIYSALQLRNLTFVIMLRKPPSAIITDQATKTHGCWKRLQVKCLLSNIFSGWFTTLLRNNYQDWCDDFYKLYKITCREEFERNRPLTVGKFNLQNNKHTLLGTNLSSRFFFFFFLRNDNRSQIESVNAFIKRFISSHTSLTDFFTQMDVAIKEMEHKCTHNKMASISLKNLREAANVLLFMLKERNCFQIPPPYLPSRWCSDAPESSSEEPEMLAMEVSEQEPIQGNNDPERWR
ncbi:hypothetical protein Cgig2_033129 [Carnegiea gigantea]|uniref:Protein FAR1-RELATED SEQUENCE n=1 Tax=Carnegiea gigantea TaxID=171969 RepID=A0A9Q1GZE9_9CARY|nr:hypothetical protein Cgig2_033129 [Carnegiea gigantea]